jgi:hypothetical protein
MVEVSAWQVRRHVLITGERFVCGRIFSCYEEERVDAHEEYSERLKEEERNVRGGYISIKRRSEEGMLGSS